MARKNVPQAGCDPSDAVFGIIAKNACCKTRKLSEHEGSLITTDLFLKIFGAFLTLKVS
jgi:hypothetical protein